MMCVGNAALGVISSIIIARVNKTNVNKKDETKIIKEGIIMIGNNKMCNLTVTGHVPGAYVGSL